MPQKLSKTRRRIAIGVLILAPLLAAGYTIDQRTLPHLRTGPMIQWPAPGTLAVTWSAKDAFTGAWAALTNPDGSNTLIRAQPVNGRYEARFTGLHAPGPYRYTVFNEGLLWQKVPLSGPNIVKMPVPPGTPFRFIAFGDSGNGSNSQTDLAEVLTAQKPDLVIHVGDLIYPAGAAKDYPLNFFQPNAALIRTVPFMPSLGNHDVATDKGRPFLDTFILPENGPDGIEPERNYYFDDGDARFVALDTNRTADGGAITFKQMKTVVAPWLRSVLTNCHARWKFVYFHHPFYTGSIHTPQSTAYVKQAYVKVFEDCSVDVVFCGHNHLYERTAPIKADKIVPAGQGVVYITTGAGGVSRYAEQDNPPQYMRSHNDEVFSFTRIDLSPNRLDIRQIDEQGQTIDQFTLTKTPRAMLSHALLSHNVPSYNTKAPGRPARGSTR